MSHEEFMRAKWRKECLSPAEITQRIRWREQNRRYYARHKDRLNAKRRAQYAVSPAHRYAIEKASRNRRWERFLEQRAASQRRYRAKTWKTWYAVPENREKVRMWRSRWYWERGGREHLRENRSPGWACEASCGRKTQHPTGLCQPCRISVCRACGKGMIQQERGQRLHRRCLPKGDACGDH